MASVLQSADALQSPGATKLPTFAENGGPDDDAQAYDFEPCETEAAEKHASYASATPSEPSASLTPEATQTVLRDLQVKIRGNQNTLLMPGRLHACCAD